MSNHCQLVFLCAGLVSIGVAYCQIGVNFLLLSLELASTSVGQGQNLCQCCLVPKECQFVLPCPTSVQCQLALFSANLASTISQIS